MKQSRYQKFQDFLQRNSAPDQWEALEEETLREAYSLISRFPWGSFYADPLTQELAQNIRSGQVDEWLRKKSPVIEKLDDLITHLTPQHLTGWEICYNGDQLLERLTTFDPERASRLIFSAGLAGIFYESERLGQYLEKVREYISGQPPEEEFFQELEDLVACNDVYSQLSGSAGNEWIRCNKSWGLIKEVAADDFLLYYDLRAYHAVYNSFRRAVNEKTIKEWATKNRKVLKKVRTVFAAKREDYKELRDICGQKLDDLELEELQSVSNVYESAKRHRLDEGTWAHFVSGLVDSIAQEQVKEWSQYVVDVLREEEIGGSNYREQAI